MSGDTGRIIGGIEPLLDRGVNLGEALRTLREARGLGIEDVAKITCIRRVYLIAIEEMRFDELPSRPFAIGYVRSFAETIGANPAAAVAKFKLHCPSPDENLKAPLGVRKEHDPRLSLAAGVAAVVVASVVIWNLAQHAVAHDGGPTPPVSAAPQAAKVQIKGAVALAAAQPAPADNDLPAPYVTPGLIKSAQSPAATPASMPVFNAKGAVYGAPADQPAIVLQASKPASLVIRGADGSIYFARQLAPGEAYRAPISVPGLTVDVSDPLSFNVFMNGQSKGQLQAAQTPIGKLAG